MSFRIEREGSDSSRNGERMKNFTENPFKQVYS